MTLPQSIKDSDYIKENSAIIDNKVLAGQGKPVVKIAFTQASTEKLRRIMSQKAP